MDTRQTLSLLVLLIHLVSESRGENLTSDATLILFEDQNLPLQKEKNLLSFLRKEKVIPPIENLIVFQTSGDVIESPSVINDELLSLLDQTTRVSEISDRKGSTIVDQVTAESRTQLNSAQQFDLDGIDNLQDVIAITEYEPQKIHPEKAKEKSSHHFGYADYETTTPQISDTNYYEVPRQRGTTRVPKYGTTKVSPNIRSTEKSRYIASETYRTSPSTFDPSNQKIKLRSLTTNPISTTPYLSPTTSVDTPFVEQTNNYDVFTTPNFPRVVNEVKILGNRTKSSKFVATTTFPSTETRRAFDSPRSLNFGNFDEGTEGTIGTTVTDSYTVPSKKSKRKKATKTVEALNVNNLDLFLKDKARQSRALNHTDNYKFGLLAKYDIMPRPFAQRRKDPLHVSAAQAESKNFLEPQILPTKPANLWNFKTVKPTLSTISRSVPTTKIIDSLTINPYSKLNAYNAPISTFSPYTTLIPPRSLSQTLQDGYEPTRVISRRISAPRMTSRGRARFNINKNTVVEIENKGISKPEYPEKISEKLVASTKFEDYKIHEKDDEARGGDEDRQELDKKKDQEQDHHRGEDRFPNNQQHKQKRGKNHDHKNRHYIDNRDNGVDDYPQDEQDDRPEDERRNKHDRDHKHHASNQKHTRIHDQEHKHDKDGKAIVRDNLQLNHRSNNHNYDEDSDKHHYSKHSSNDSRSREQLNEEDEDNKYNHGHHKDDDIEDHKSEDVEEANHRHYNDPQYRDHHHHHEIRKEKDLEQDEDHDHHVYESGQDNDSNDDDQDTYDESHVLEDKHHVEDHDKHQDQNHDQDIDDKKKLQDDDRDNEENKGEFTHKHEHKQDHKKEGGDHNHEAGGGAEHEVEHHSEEGDKGDKGYEAWHENENAEKGHLDKENHHHSYDEKEGDKKKHHDEGGYRKEHHFGEKGEKAAEFGEKGEHQSGHNTKGQHFIHKKDEYEKKTEFFDEFHDDGDSEKEEEFHHEYKAGKGGHHRSDKHDAGHLEEKHGKEHHHMMGHHHEEDKGHKEEEGHEEHHDHEQKYGKKGGHEEGKKWAHKKGK